jgi:hypothetical protein
MVECLLWVICSICEIKSLKISREKIISIFMFTFLSKFSLSKMSSIDQEQLEQISDEDKGRVQIPRSHEHRISEESKGDNIEVHTENNHVGLCKTKQNDQRVLRLETDVVKGQKVHNLALQNNSRSTDSKHYERAVYLSKGQKSTSKLMEKLFEFDVRNQTN